MLTFIYIVLIFLVIRFCVTLFNFLSHPKLGHYGVHYTDKVSLLIPARNEAKRILPLLQSIVNQDFKNYEVIVLDDHSTDETYPLCSTFSAQNSNFKVIKGAALPQDWLGKNYACHQLAQQATGKYLLFLDADEVIYNGLIQNSLHRMKLHKLSLLSLFTWQKMETYGEKTTVPLMHFLLLNLLPLVLVRISKWSTFSAASGQMMLFDAETYHQHLWHEQVRSKVVEDIEIVKKVKMAQLPAEALLANKMIACRMYENYQEALDGFSKNIIAGFGNQILGLCFYLLMVVIGPLCVFWYLPISLWILPLGLIILSRLMISLLAHQNPLHNIIFHPIQMINLMIISSIAIYRKITKQNQWKGRSI